MLASGIGHRASGIGHCLLFALYACSTEPAEQSDVETVQRAVEPARVTPRATRRPIELPACVGRNCQGEFPSPLELDELVEDGEHLFFALHWNAGSAEASPASRVPVVLVLANGQPIPNPRVVGVVDSQPGARSWIGVPLSELPEGELDVVLRVLGTEIPLALAKEGAGLRNLSRSMRRDYQYDPAAFVDPKTGATIPAEGFAGPAHDVYEVAP